MDWFRPRRGAVSSAQATRLATNSAIRSMDLKWSNSMSSSATVTPNSRSRCNRRSTNTIESSAAVSNRSVSTDGTSSLSLSRKT